MNIKLKDFLKFGVRVHRWSLWFAKILDLVPSFPKVHRWSLWLTKILDLVPRFPKVHRWSLWFSFCNTFSPQLFPKVHGWGGPGLHFVIHLVLNLALLKRLDLLARD
ncbi:hypothetical protein Hanom_Chr16g01448721 [Helianthus anomalus]